MSFNNTLQQVANFCATHSDLLPLSGVGGYANEPFLSIANDALSDLLTVENDWKLNRAEMNMFVTTPQKQDYLFAGATAFSLGATSQGWGIDLATNNAVAVTAGVVTVTFLENHRFAIGDTIYLAGVVMVTGAPAAYNSIFTDTGKATAWTQGYIVTSIALKSVTFNAAAGQVNGDTGGSFGITDYFALSSASMVQMVSTSSPQYTVGLTCYRELPVVGRVSNPDKVCVLQDLNNGVLKLRCLNCPGSTTWGISLVYQKQAPTKVSLGDKWDPFPDNYSAVYRQAVVYRMYRWLNSPQQASEYAKLQEEIHKQQAADDTEETSVSLQPEEPLMGMSVGDGGWFGW